ncbi:MAG: PorT family protein [Cryobacterium sp.]|nr:PorT family protein [Oligoflexia bacterium]
MKTFLILCALATLGTASASTKDFGVYGGLNAATIHSPASNLSATGGLLIGAQTFLPLNETLEFTPSLQLAQRGFSVDNVSVVGSPFTVDVHYHATFLELPLLFRAKVPVGTLDSYLTAGPNFGLKLGSSCSIRGGYQCTVLNDESVKSTLFGIELGFGSDFILSNTNEVGFEVRYHLGFTQFAKDTEGKNRGLALLFHFNF